MDKENNLCEPSAVDIFPLKKTSTEFTNDSVSELKAHSKQKKEDGRKPSMDSFITVRPPRGRRHSQPVAIYNPATIDRDNHSSKMAPTHRHRSSSQPRPYQESFPPPQRHHSVRSASQPRSTQNSHFLESFNVADCHDVRWRWHRSRAVAQHSPQGSGARQQLPKCAPGIEHTRN